ncbi:SAM-dependent methyltransferase [Dactylosporangium sp. NPDC051485]|uniref:SAM-dependent methyltransferase n=1 Tax=Dactylosporangium sp. NPDC051485 TaxID=3154846 RepID=UPI003431B98E
MTTPAPSTPSAQPAAADADGTANLRIDTSVPHPARRYDFLLGGKDNFAPDRESARQLIAAFPAVRTAALENRRFLGRVVEYLTAEAGVRQFLDIGTGIPTSPNVHEIAQAIAPDARVVYVDNDPMVMVHARALLTGNTPDSTAYIEADIRNPDTILDSPELHQTLDFTKPIALLLIAVLHFLEDSDQPYKAVSQLLDALPPGSYVALSHVTFDALPDEVRHSLTALADPAAGHGPFRARTRGEVAQFFNGVDLLEPGLVSIVEWLPEREPRPQTSCAAEAMAYGAVGRLR